MMVLLCVVSLQLCYGDSIPANEKDDVEAFLDPSNNAFKGWEHKGDKINGVQKNGADIAASEEKLRLLEERESQLRIIRENEAKRLKEEFEAQQKM